jgi:hypothetical protein
MENEFNINSYYWKNAEKMAFWKKSCKYLFNNPLENIQLQFFEIFGGLKPENRSFRDGIIRKISFCGLKNGKV